MPWNHLHMCTVVLWTKIVVEFVSIPRIQCSDKETGEQNAMRFALDVSASNNLLCEFVSRCGFADACEYCIPSSSNVMNVQFKYCFKFISYQ